MVLPLICGSIFLLMSLPIILTRWKQIQQMADACSELARRTGMSYVTPLASPHGILFNLGSWTIRHATATGTYRGRTATFSMTGEGGGWTGEYGESSPYQYAVVSLGVANNAQYRLTIEGKGFLSRLFHRSVITTSVLQFNQKLVIIGKPQDFLQRVGDWIPSIVPHLLAWMIEEQPRITLRGSKMTCKHSLIKDIERQVSILNLMCDLADLAEHSGSNSVVSGVE